MSCQQYLSERQVSEITGISMSTLQKDRHMRKGLPYIKIGKTVRYAYTDIVEAMNAYKIRPAER